MRQLRGIISGQVQGVGFRATAKRIADSLQLLGYVRNCPDGTVEITLQGDENNLKVFVSSMRKVFERKYSQNWDLQFSDSTQVYFDFSIHSI